MKKIGVIVNTKRSHSGDILQELRRLCGGHGFRLYAEEAAIAEQLGAAYLPIQSFADEVDAVLALGGDGTVLYAARAMHGTGIPIMGINLGSLGFLTSVGDSEVEPALLALAGGAYKVSERSVAECSINKGGEAVGLKPALNDIVLGWGGSSRIVTLQLSIDGESVGSFMCDGMIVSTPTGSTGHALSAGGPILHPGVEAFSINVICPHTLSSRPLVVPNGCVIEVEVVNAAKELILSIDGQDEHRVGAGDVLKVAGSRYPIKFIQLPSHSYFSVLSQKLHWRGSSY